MTETQQPTFSPVTVKNLYTHGDKYIAQLQQNELNDVAADGHRFGLQRVITGASTVLVNNKRTVRQELSAKVWNTLVVGQELPGHITRRYYDKPQFPGHQPAWEGGYALTKYCPDGYVADEDYRTPSVQAEGIKLLRVA